MPAATYELILGIAIAYGAQHTDVGKVVKVTKLPNLKGENIDITRVNKTMTVGQATVPDLTKEYAPGMSDPGTLEFVLGLDADQYAAVLAQKDVVQAWKITFKSGNYMTFNGYLQDVGGEAAENQEIMVSCVVKVSGMFTFTKAGGGQ